MEIIKLLLEKGMDIDVQNKQDNKTALHYASRYNHLEVVEFLLEKEQMWMLKVNMAKLL